MSDARLPTTRLMLREYLRVSVDRSGRKRSPDEQHHDHEYDARERGWDLHPKPYRDLGSASRYARKARSDFDRLVADIEKGEFSANILGLWEGSRGSRKVGEWVQLVEALEERGILVWIHVRRRLFDPRNPHDRADLLSDAIKHELSSAETSDRSKRAASANAAAGKPHGKFQRGYKRIYDETTRKLVQQVHDPEWAPLIEELFDRGLRREGLHRIAEDWKARGIVHSQGRPFSQQQLRKMLLSPAYAGLRRIKKTDGSTSYVDGQWEGIVSKALFFDVKKWLEDPSRRTTLDGRARHLLSVSSAAVCDVCDGPLSSFNDRRSGTPRYKCSAKGHVMVTRSHLDQFAVDVMLGWLADKENCTALAQPGESHDAELARVRDDLAEARSELIDLARRVSAGQLSVSFAATVTPGIETRIDGLEAREQELTTPSALVGLLGKPGGDVAARWNGAAIETRRTIARLLLSPPILGQMRLARSPRPRASVPIEDRVKWRTA